jgi:hypothetical protein
LLGINKINKDKHGLDAKINKLYLESKHPRAFNDFDLEKIID